MRYSYSFLIIALLLLTSATQGQDAGIKQFELFTNCQPLRVFHSDYISEDGLTDDAKAMGLTVAGIQNILESRLRSARLYKEEGFSYPALAIQMAILNDSAYMNLQLMKIVSDEVSGVKNAVITWSRAVMFTGADSGNTVSGLSELVDEFLVEYLRVNEPACD